jgi:hypothetical protein
MPNAPEHHESGPSYAMWGESPDDEFRLARELHLMELARMRTAEVEARATRAAYAVTQAVRSGASRDEIVAALDAALLPPPSSGGFF